MRPIIALDADGVLVDYHHAYADAWAKAFGRRPALRDPAAYWPMDRWDVRRLTGDELETFRKCFDAEFWSSIPAMAGALEACRELVEAGYDLVCVTAMEMQFETARLRNLRGLGFPIERVIATANAQSAESPKRPPCANCSRWLSWMTTCLTCGGSRRRFMRLWCCGSRTGHQIVVLSWSRCIRRTRISRRLPNGG